MGWKKEKKFFELCASCSRKIDGDRFNAQVYDVLTSNLEF